jgi:RpiR family carbohydrate utilization transcriptional regulator
MSNESSNGVSGQHPGLVRWLGTVAGRSGDLATSEAKVVALVMSDPLFVGTSTTAQVAARARVSAPSVVRAARAIGFAGFSDLKLEIARARGATEFFSPPPALTDDAPTADVLESVTRTGIEALTALAGALDLAALDRAVDAVLAARQVLVVGAGTSAAVAADAVFRLRALGVGTVTIPDHESAMIATRLLDERDVVVAISSTGRTSSTLGVADAATSVGAIALAVGGAALPGQMAAAGSRLAQLVVVDALAAALALRDPERRRRAERAGMDLPNLT